MTSAIRTTRLGPARWRSTPSPSSRRHGPNFPWADYDVEDQGDLDGDGNLFEPDGALDHVIVLHAGKDQAAGGGAEGTYAEWSSSSVVGATTGGVTVPAADGLRVLNYTTQPENAGIGVIAHEYGHDLGLPDLYDSVGPGTDTDVGWWDLMSTGSHSGRLFQVLPTHMGAWSKYVLGWIEPEVLEYGSRRANVTLGQASRPPRGTDTAVKVNLPAKRVQVGEPHSGELAWWSSNDQSYADVRLTRSIDVPTGSDVRFWSWNNYTIEEFWDYGFIEVSTNGTTWTQLEVFDEDGTLVSTDEDPERQPRRPVRWTAERAHRGHRRLPARLRQPDPVRRARPFSSGSATSPTRPSRSAAGSPTTSRSPPAATTVLTDDVENGLNGWTAQPGTLTDTTGNGWVQTSGTFDYEQYYLAEWRNFDGYDNGLRTPYTTNWLSPPRDEWNVSRTPYNAPGLLIWHRDQSHSINDLANNLFDPPSIGSKGTVLLVDSHYEPERFRGAAAAANPSLLDNLGSRQQASDVAFGPVGRYPFRACVPDPEGDAYDVICNFFGTTQARSPGSATLSPGIPGSSTGPISTRRRRTSSGTWTPRLSSRHGATRSTPPGSWTGTAGWCRRSSVPTWVAGTCSAPATRGTAAGHRGRGPGHHGRPVPRRRDPADQAQQKRPAGDCPGSAGTSSTTRDSQSNRDPIRASPAERPARRSTRSIWLASIRRCSLDGRMPLPEGLSIRALVFADARAVYEVMAAQELVDVGEVVLDEADIVADWQRPSFDVGASTVGVFAAERLVGYAEITSSDRADTAVHPAFRGRGIGGWLAQWVQEKARDRGAAVIGMPVPQGSAGDRLLESLGYRVRWTSWILRLPEGAESRAGCYRPASPCARRPRRTTQPVGTSSRTRSWNGRCATASRTRIFWPRCQGGRASSRGTCASSPTPTK